jgi:hypothetical protein
MQFSRSRVGPCFSLAAAVVLAGCASPPAHPADEGWQSLFDGRTLDGWVQRGGKAEYRVEDGCIVGETRPDQPNTFLCSTQEFCDFTLELKFRVDPSLNSGVQFRSQARPEKGSERVFGYQAEIDPSARAWTGGIYDEGRRAWFAPIVNTPEARTAFRQGEWNSMRIECRGDRMQTWINGVSTADIRDAMTPCGFIALQVHGVGPRQEPLTVRWRSLRIRPEPK